MLIFIPRKACVYYWSYSQIFVFKFDFYQFLFFTGDDEEFEGDENASTHNTKHENSSKNEEDGVENKSPLRELTKSQSDNNYDSDVESRPHSRKSGEKRPLE
jgi:hypothetical protein